MFHPQVRPEIRHAVKSPLRLYIRKRNMRFRDDTPHEHIFRRSAAKFADVAEGIYVLRVGVLERGYDWV